MTQQNSITTVSLPSALVEVRGPSGRLYGQLDVCTGVITFKCGQRRESIDLTPYFKAAKVKKEEYQER